MIPSNLLDVFGALSVGMLTIGFLSMVVWVFDRNNLTYTGYVAGLAVRPRGKLWALIFILFCFGFGLLVEDFTDHLTDSDANYSEYTPQSYQQCFLGKESDYRFDALYVPYSLEEPDVFKLSRLGKEVFDDEEYIAHVVDEKFAKLSRKRISDEAEFMKKGVNALYYDAKNWCYGQANYYSELESIQQRIDFSRSCFLIASWMLIVLIVVLMFDFLFIWRSPQSYRKKFRFFVPNRRLRHSSEGALAGTSELEGTSTSDVHWNSDSDIEGNKEYDRTKVGEEPWGVPYGDCFKRNLFFLLASILLIMACGAIGYKHAEEIYNERAFGYHVSARKSGEVKTRGVKHQQNESLVYQPVETKVPVATPDIKLEANKALLWTRDSAEYAALCSQVFRNAEDHVKEITTPTPPDSKPWVVVMDLDETVLDNTSYNVKRALIGESYSSASWDHWLENDSLSVRCVPGAKTFIDSIPDDVHLVFISNRKDKRRAETISTLYRLEVTGAMAPQKSKENEFDAYWDKHLLLVTDAALARGKNPQGKESRREKVKEDFSIAAMLGDSLADFSIRYEKLASPLGDRRAIAKIEANFGENWFVLPNPVYGTWAGMTEKQFRGIFEKAANGKGGGNSPRLPKATSTTTN